MEVGECLRVERRFLFLQGTAKALMLACLFWSTGRGVIWIHTIAQWTSVL